MSNDSMENPPDFLSRLLDLVDTWREEITEITISQRSTSNLLGQITDCQKAIKSKMETLVTDHRELGVHLANLRQHCSESQRRREKKRGVIGVLDWAVTRAQHQTKAFLLVLLAIIALSVLAAVLGWDLTRFLTM